MEELLTHWRRARHPSTSELIEQVGAKFEVELESLPPKKGEAVRAWLNAVKTEPASYLTARLAQLERFARTTTASTLWPLFEALAKLPADPRIATLVTRALTEDFPVERTDRMVRRLLDCIETHADDSHYRALELGLELRLLDDGIAARAVRIMQRGLLLKPEGPEFSAAERAAFLAREWKLEPVTAREDPLAAVYAAPDDDARKQVLADVLLEKGDPRGEFISLQLAGSGARRQQSLLAHHRGAWLGPLLDVVELKRDKPLFEKGFVSELSIKPTVKRSQFQLVADAIEWATVKRVRRGLLQFSRAMSSLQHSGPVPLETLKRWKREGFSLPLKSLSTGGDPTPVIETLTDLPVMPKWLGVRFTEWEPTRQLRDAFVTLTGFGGLERLRLGASENDVWPGIVKETGLAFLPPTLTHLELDDEGERRVEWVRDGRKWLMTLREFDGRLSSQKWKRVLENLTQLEVGEVRLVVSSEAALMDAAEVSALARWFKLPMGTAVEPMS